MVNLPSFCLSCVFPGEAGSGLSSALLTGALLLAAAARRRKTGRGREELVKSEK
jgi:hypothetical protein